MTQASYVLDEPRRALGIFLIAFGKPLANQIAELQEIFVFRGFAEISVGPIQDDILPILGGARSGNYNDRRAPAATTPAQVLQDLHAMFLGQVDVQDHQAGQGADSSRSALSKKRVASSPSLTTWTGTWRPLASIVSRIRKTSAGLSSTTRM
jgi:hypothetical protein